jgi:hypothetical protein
MKPRRVQLSRAKCWRKPEGVIVVSRPSKWGNPYKPSADTMPARAAAVAKYRAALMKGKLRVTVEDARQELKGKSLGCWCSLDGPCHAEVLIELANK